MASIIGTDSRKISDHLAVQPFTAQIGKNPLTTFPSFFDVVSVREYGKFLEVTVDWSNEIKLIRNIFDKIFL